MLQIEENQVSSWKIIGTALFYFTLSVAPTMTLIPVTALATLSISVGAAYFLKRFMEKNPNAFDPMKRFLLLNGTDVKQTEKSEEGLIDNSSLSLKEALKDFAGSFLSVSNVERVPLLKKSLSTAGLLRDVVEIDQNSPATSSCSEEMTFSQNIDRKSKTENSHIEEMDVELGISNAFLNIEVARKSGANSEPSSTSNIDQHYDNLAEEFGDHLLETKSKENEVTSGELNTNFEVEKNLKSNRDSEETNPSVLQQEENDIREDVVNPSQGKAPEESKEDHDMEEQEHSSKDRKMQGKLPESLPSSSRLDNLLFMNQSTEEIENLLFQETIAYREQFHRQKSSSLDSVGSFNRSPSEIERVSDSPPNDSMTEISLEIDETSGKEESLHEDGDPSALPTVEAPDRTVTLEYFLTPIPECKKSQDLPELQPLSPTSNSQNSNLQGESSDIRRMCTRSRSFTAPTLDFEPELYGPARRRRPDRHSSELSRSSLNRSLEASPAEIAARARGTRSPSPTLPPTNALSTRLLPLDGLLEEKEEKYVPRDAMSPSQSADDVLEPLLLRDADILSPPKEKNRSRRYSSLSRQKSLLSELASKKKALGRTAKSLGKKAGILRR